MCRLLIRKAAMNFGCGAKTAKERHTLILLVGVAVNGILDFFSVNFEMLE